MDYEAESYSWIAIRWAAGSPISIEGAVIMGLDRAMDSG